MRQEKSVGVENIRDREIREKISDVLELIRRDKNYNLEAIDEGETISTLVDQFNSLPEDATRKEGFLATIE